jgi:hypothetical protein
MSIEEQLREAIDRHVDPPVDDGSAWREIERRVESGTTTSNGKRHQGTRQRIVAAVVAFAVFGAAAALLGVAIYRSRGKPSSEGPSSSATATPPAWLVRKAGEMARANGDAAPTSAEWVLTDAATIQQAFNYTSIGEPDPTYLVVMHGQFVANGPAPSGVPAPTGTMLFLVLDPSSHDVTNLGVGNREASVPGLAPISLPLEWLVPSGSTYELSNFRLGPTHGPGNPGVAVTFDSSWSSDTYPGEAECKIELVDADGDVVGHADLGLGTLNPKTTGITTSLLVEGTGVDALGHVGRV